MNLSAITYFTSLRIEYISIPLPFNQFLKEISFVNPYFAGFSD